MKSEEECFNSTYQRMIDYSFNRIPLLKINKQWVLPQCSKLGTIGGTREEYDSILTVVFILMCLRNKYDHHTKPEIPQYYRLWWNFVSKEAHVSENMTNSWDKYHMGWGRCHSMALCIPAPPLHITPRAPRPQPITWTLPSPLAPEATFAPGRAREALTSDCRYKVYTRSVQKNTLMSTFLQK